jgi:hypothetical protein
MIVLVGDTGVAGGEAVGAGIKDGNTAPDGEPSIFPLIAIDSVNEWMGSAIGRGTEDSWCRLNPAEYKEQ